MYVAIERYQSERLALIRYLAEVASHSDALALSLRNGMLTVEDSAESMGTIRGLLTYAESARERALAYESILYGSERRK